MPVAQNPALSIEKTVTDVDGDGEDGAADAAGDIITYHIDVKNTGNVTLTGLNVRDRVEAYADIDAKTTSTRRI